MSPQTPREVPDRLVSLDGSIHLLCVHAAELRCGLPIEAVVEVHPAVQLLLLPGAPSVVLGLVNRRGAALPVLDLRRRLGLPTRGTRLGDHLVVVRLPDRELALQVDAAVEVLSVPAGAVDRAVVQASDAVLGQGVAVLEDGLLVVLDVRSFLSSQDDAELQAALAQAPETSLS